MKKLYIVLFIVSILGLQVSCTKDFADINTDPGMVTTPDLGHMFTYSLWMLGDYQYTEWFYDNYQYHWRYSQACIPMSGNSADFNMMGATGSRLYEWYNGIMPNLFEIRRIIDAKDEATKVNYQYMRAITYIPQILQGIKVTDIYGSVPYTEAMQGRYQSNFTPIYDTQQQLFDTWLAELDEVIDILTSGLENQVSYRNQDFVYSGDFDKWAKLANSLKLRIAVRLLNADNAKAQEIIDEVVASPAGLITEESDQMVWIPANDYRGRAHDFWGSPSGAKNFVDFLRNNHDPRVRFFFERNGFDQASVDSLTAQGKRLPSFVNTTVTEPWDRYQGGFVTPDSVMNFDCFFEIKDNSNVRYQQLSHINRRLFNPQYNNGTGYWVDVMFSSAEVCLYLAEFTEKGYISNYGSLNAQGWYEKGITASINTYNMIADRSDLVDYDLLQLDPDEIANYLDQEDVAYGTDNLEKIYIQQFINFFRLPNELNTLTRRTGYPRKESELFAWEPVTATNAELKLPRRFTVTRPTDLTNVENWNKAMTDQGFTNAANDGNTLNSERVWWDITSPDYGEGNASK